MAGAVGPFLRWLFRDRQTGRIVVMQWPNVQLWLWIAASAVNGSIHPMGWLGTALSVIGTAALSVWALDEIGRGVNPWRRLLGGGVLALLVIRAVVAAL